MTNGPAYQEILKSELQKRCEKNNRYSLRAFSKTLRIDAPTISKVLSGKLVPSKRLGERLINGLGLDPDQREVFWNSLMTKKFKVPAPPSEITADKILSQDTFSVISEWYHYALLELAQTRESQADPAWIAQRLGISEMTAKFAVERLVKLGLVERKGKRLLKTSKLLTVENPEVTGPALRRRQKEILKKSLDSLEVDGIERRNHTGITFAMDPNKIPEARKRIRDFMRRLCAYLETGERKEVYELQTSLFPLSRSRE
jgi:uncharacterized protein (TIGR02147 family)